MASLNKVYLIGNLTRDPETRTLKSGSAVANMRMAISEKYKTKEGKETESVCYVDVVAWSPLAENCAKFLSKGSPVMVEGMLQLDEWEKDGKKHGKLVVRASAVEFLGKRKQENDEDQVVGREDDGEDEGKPPF